MTILEWILSILGLIFIVPVLAFLCGKFGTVGFYRGKEAMQQKEDEVNVNNTENNNKETEKL